MTNIRLALCGASGSGKSTLARYLSGKLDIPYMENSAGLILPQEVQERFVRQYGWTKSGHSDVIRLGNINPGFAVDFQTELLRVRAQFIKDREEFIFDRSPIDNLTYFLLQCGHLVDKQRTATHIAQCLLAMRPITHVIFLHTSDQGELEDNGSRVHNWYYQKAVTAVFKHVISTYFDTVDAPQYFLELPMWDWKTRTRITDNFIKDSQLLGE